MRGKRRSVLKLSDIRTIWPEAGISDAVIDFFVLYKDMVSRSHKPLL